MQQAGNAELLHNFIASIAAWVATWGGIMAVHYFIFERKHKDFSYLFLDPKSSRLKSVNWSAFVAFAAGIVMTWMCMYGSVPALQGPIASAVGGIDFSWLGGTLTSAAVYFALGYPRFRARINAGVPLGLKMDLSEGEFIKEFGSAEDLRKEQRVAGEQLPASRPAARPEPDAAPDKAPVGS
ncbi:cytosine permease [Glutamicibacter nicotianae]|uniref:cytosine permease n=1 Tax=Glutamicibacter nicotianae TaxID=37929 RepID=UPI003C2B223E